MTYVSGRYDVVAIVASQAGSGVGAGAMTHDEKSVETKGSIEYDLNKRGLTRGEGR
jgi:hypothetical protein